MLQPHCCNHAHSLAGHVYPNVPFVAKSPQFGFCNQKQSVRQRLEITSNDRLRVCSCHALWKVAARRLLVERAEPLTGCGSVRVGAHLCASRARVGRSRSLRLVEGVAEVPLSDVVAVFRHLRRHREARPVGPEAGRERAGVDGLTATRALPCRPRRRRWWRWWWRWRRRRHRSAFHCRNHWLIGDPTLIRPAFQPQEAVFTPGLPPAVLDDPVFRGVLDTITHLQAHAICQGLTGTPQATADEL